MRLEINNSYLWHLLATFDFQPGACLENVVVNPAFDTIRIRDELIYQTKAEYFKFKNTFLTYCFI